MGLDIIMVSKKKLQLIMQMIGREGILMDSLLVFYEYIVISTFLTKVALKNPEW